MKGAKGQECYRATYQHAISQGVEKLTSPSMKTFTDSYPLFFLLMVFLDLSRKFLRAFIEMG